MEGKEEQVLGLEAEAATLRDLLNKLEEVRFRAKREHLPTLEEGLPESQCQNLKSFRPRLAGQGGASDAYSCARRPGNPRRESETAREGHTERKRERKRETDRQTDGEIKRETET